MVVLLVAVVSSGLAQQSSSSRRTGVETERTGGWRSGDSRTATDPTVKTTRFRIPDVSSPEDWRTKTKLLREDENFSREMEWPEEGRLSELKKMKSKL